MSQKIEVDYSGPALIYCVTFLLVIYQGEPDLYDAIVAFINRL